MAPNLRKRQNSPNFYRSETKKHKKESSSSSESEDEIEEENDLSDNEDCINIEEELKKLKKQEPLAFANLHAVKEEILRTEPDAKKCF